MSKFNSLIDEEIGFCLNGKKFLCVVFIYFILFIFLFGGSVVKNLPSSVGDAGLVPGSGRLPGEGNGSPVQYSCLGNPMDRGA